MIIEHTPLAYSVAQFCRLHNLSRATFYVLKKQGKTPALMSVGRRVLISAEAAQKWRQQMTQATETCSSIE